MLFFEPLNFYETAEKCSFFVRANNIEKGADFKVFYPFISAIRCCVVAGINFNIFLTTTNLLRNTLFAVVLAPSVVL